PRTYRKSDLENGQDVQGIDWRKLETTRSKARSVRSQLYCQFEPIHVGFPNPILLQNGKNATKTTNCDDYFRFTRVNNEHRAYITHFQLRNLIAATSRNDIYYANKYKIMHTDLSDQVNECAIDLTKTSTDSWDNSGGFVTTTLTATEEALIGGSFFGEYVVKSLKSDYDEPPTIGAVTQETNGITNHVHAFNSRTNGQRQAAFCNNDQHLRLLDLTTNSFTGDFTYPAAINCAATSPNGQMRIVVGDFLETLITNAQTGKPFESLLAHTDHVFACAWADDGIHIATGAQDCRIAIHDARWWARPVAVISSEMACPRSLSFSPVGSGKRLLLAAEADDFVHVIDAVGFTKKQTVDFFGPIGGACWTGDGGEFVVSNSDARLGGLMGFER
ncbi:WD40 repeat-like protein, partial [Patellaria atrata CBS 101060]